MYSGTMKLHLVVKNLLSSVGLQAKSLFQGPVSRSSERGEKLHFHYEYKNF